VITSERWLDTVPVYNAPHVAEREGFDMTETLAEFRAAMPVEPDLTVLLTVDEETRRERQQRHRPELLDEGSVPERHAGRQRRYRDLLSDREDAVVYENDGDISTAVAEIAAEING
jgi:thymidylate kinase